MTSLPAIFPSALGLIAAFLLSISVEALAQLPKTGTAPPPPSLEPGRIWNPFQPAADNHPQTLRILVLNYDPIVPAEGHRRLSEVFKWNAPERLALRYRAAMEYAAGGAIRYEIAEWRNLNEIYAQRDGYRYTVEEYVKNRRAGSGWHEGKGQDYPRLLREQGVAEMVSRGLVDEVWIFSDHFFGLWEASMAGPGAFNINGGVYPEVPATRPFAFYGFNYERGVAEMMHDAAHRTEATLNRVYGGWKLAAPVSNWDRFSANFLQSNGVAGVGTCHWPANAERDYDYGNKRTVESWADAFLTYPQLDWTTKPVSRETWAGGKDDHLDYMKWYFAHVPRASGVNADGRQNNWFKYIWNFENYDRTGRPLPGGAKVIGQPVAMVGEAGVQFAVGFSDAAHIGQASLAATALEVLAPNGSRVPVSFAGADGTTGGPFRVASFAVAAAGGKWRAEQAGAYRVRLRAGAVRNLSGGALDAAEIGTFRVSAAADAGELTPSATTLVLAPGERRDVRLAAVSDGRENDLTHAALWSSTDPTIAAITGAGSITAAKPGRTVLRASHAGRTVSIPVEVSAALPSVRLSAKELPVKAGDPLVVKVSFRGGQDVAADSIGLGDILLLGTNGLFAFAEAPANAPASAPGEIVVTYSIPAPAQGWPAGASRGQLQFKAWQVHDSAGVFFPETDLGTVEIQPRGSGNER